MGKQSGLEKLSLMMIVELKERTKISNEKYGNLIEDTVNKQKLKYSLSEEDVYTLNNLLLQLTRQNFDYIYGEVEKINSKYI